MYVLWADLESSMSRCASVSEMYVSEKMISNYLQAHHRQRIRTAQQVASKPYLRIGQQVVVDAEAGLPSSAKLQAG